MNPKRLRMTALVACLLASAASFGGCGREKTTPPPSPKSTAPQRIVSVSPNTTEILFALGLGERLVGVSTADDYPPEVKNIEKVGDFGAPNMELLVDLKPDLLVATQLMKPGLAEQIEKSGIKVFLAGQNSFDGMFDSILKLGEITGAQERAKQLVDQMRQRMAVIDRKIAGIPAEKRPRVFIEIEPGPLYTAGKGSFSDELVTRAGGVNIAASMSQPFAQVSGEFVVQQDPDVILVCHPTAEKNAANEIAQRIGWSQMKAVKGGRIIADINPDLLCRPGPRLIDGVEKLHAELYPQ